MNPTIYYPLTDHGIRQNFILLLSPFFKWIKNILSILKISPVLAASTVHDEKVVSFKEEVNLEAAHLLDTYGNHILRLAYSYLHNEQDAEEILQDTLLKYLQSAPSLSSEEHKKAWLLHVAANLSKNRITYNKLRCTDELDESLVAEDREDLSFVWESMKQLPHKYREVIHLYYYEGYSTADIAQILSRKESTIRSDLHRGRALLKIRLKEAYDFE